MDSIFSAQGPSLGYLYQIRYGLFLLVSSQNPDSKLFIEKMDDISIETPSSMNYYQTKYHVNSVANLTDSSPDLWKTIRVWSEQLLSGQIDINNSFFNLITTATTSQNTIPYLLKNGSSGSRDIELIQSRLKGVTLDSKNLSNSSAYDAFSNLDDEQQKTLISKISVLDGALELDDIKNQIKKFLIYSTAPERIESLFERLEGWFLGKVFMQLQNKMAEISGKDVQAKILDIADCLKSDNLPADFPSSIASDEDLLSPYRGQQFVRQLEIIGINHKLINHAISDYHRAFSQKSKWLREGLIIPQDDMEYDKKIVDDWERKFATLDDCSGRDDLAKKTEGKLFYENYYVITCPDIHFKDRFKERYMITGSCQILSDKKKVGWHPDYKDII